MKSYALLTGTVVVMVAAGIAPAERVVGPAAEASAGAAGPETALISSADIAAHVRPITGTAAASPGAPGTQSEDGTSAVPAKVKPEAAIQPDANEGEPQVADDRVPDAVPQDLNSRPEAVPGSTAHRESTPGSAGQRERVPTSNAQPENAPRSSVQPDTAPTTTVQREDAPTSDVTSPTTGGARRDADLDLSGLNGIGLDDSARSVTDRIGQPQYIESDKLLPEYKEYVYGLLRVGIENGVVQRVAVSGAEPVRIGKRETPWSREALERRLGKPDYVAEDGLVFVQGDHVLKVFLDQGGALQEIHLYPMSAV